MLSYMCAILETYITQEIQVSPHYKCFCKLQSTIQTGTETKKHFFFQKHLFKRGKNVKMLLIPDESLHSSAYSPQ